MLSRVFRLGTTVVVLGLMATSAGAQGPGGRGGPGGGRGFTMGPTGTATELMGLLATPEIRKEVQLSDEGFAAVDKLLKENEAARGGGRGAPGGGPGGPGGGAGGPGGGQPDPEREARMKKAREDMAAGQKKIDEAVLAALSDEQKKSLETLKGAKFEFPESLRSGFGGMRGGFGGFGGGFGGGPGGGRGGDQSEEDREKARAEREQRAKEAAKKAQEMLDEVLPPEGMDRLIGLFVQLRGNSSITGELPSKKLGLSEADTKKINELVGKLRAEQMQEMMQNFGGGRGNRQGGRPDSGT